MKPDWLPDWEDESQYPDVDKTDDVQWAWEFLRRNKEYQKDWEDLFPISFSEDIEAFKNIELPEGIDSWEEHFKDVAGMPSVNGELGCREKYGIQYLLNPSVSKPGHNFFEKTYGLSLTFASEDAFKRYKEENKVFIKFDLNLPLEKQLTMAKTQLTRLQKHIIGETVRDLKEYKNLWKRYLRILDAKYIKEKNIVIVKVLYPNSNDGESSLRKNYKTANLLRDKYYLFIAR